jgi:hypothetical protein
LIWQRTEQSILRLYDRASEPRMSDSDTGCDISVQILDIREWIVSWHLLRASASQAICQSSDAIRTVHLRWKRRDLLAR